MSTADFHSGRPDGMFAVTKPGGERSNKDAPMRFRGWLVLALGLGSWAGLLKVCGWL